MSMNINDYLKDLEVSGIKGSPDSAFNSIQYDSRKVEKGDLFVAIRGAAADGHNFIAKAIEQGASVVVCEEMPEAIENVTFIKVENSRKALAALSHAMYGNPTRVMKMLGVTGTNGKTTVTYLLKSIYEAAGFKCGLIGTTGIYIGNEFVPATHTTPESLELAAMFSRMSDESIWAAVMEVSSHALHQHRADYIDFDGAIFTNLSHDHLDYHHTIEEYAAAKRRLFDSLKPDAAAVVNGDDKYGGFMLENCKAAVKVKVGRNEGSDVRIVNERTELNGTRFTLESSHAAYNLDIDINLPGSFNIENAAFAAVLALSKGITKNKVIDGLKMSTGAPGRMQKINLKNGAIGIVDYAHTPDALEKALKACRNYLEDAKAHGSLICVFGCGGDRDAAKRPKMGAIASELADKVVVTNDNPRTEDPANIIREIIKGIPETSRDKVEVEEDRAKAIEIAYRLSKAKDLILVAGKGHEDYQIIGTKKIHSDDVELLAKHV